MFILKKNQPKAFNLYERSNEIDDKGIDMSTRDLQVLELLKSVTLRFRE